MRSRFVIADGTKTHYLEKGTGDLVVLLHGTSLAIDARATWFRTIPALSDRYHVIAPDLLGFGGTEGRYVIGRDRIQHALAFLRILNLENITLVGHSEGGLIGLWLAANYPHLIARLVIVTSGSSSPMLGGAKDDAWKAACDAVYNYVRGAETEADFIAMNRGLSTTNPSEFTALMEKNYRDAVKRGQLVQLKAASQDIAYLSDMDFKEKEIYPRLAELKTPIMLVWARDDATVVAERGLKLLDLIPNGELHVFTRAAHMVMIDRAEAFNRLLMDWIGKTDEKP